MEQDQDREPDVRDRGVPGEEAPASSPDNPDGVPYPADAADPDVPAPCRRERIGSAGGGPYTPGTPGHHTYDG